MGHDFDWSRAGSPETNQMARYPTIVIESLAELKEILAENK
jgi:hypothetical protein